MLTILISYILSWTISNCSFIYKWYWIRWTIGLSLYLKYCVQFTPCFRLCSFVGEEVKRSYKWLFFFFNSKNTFFFHLLYLGHQIKVTWEFLEEAAQCCREGKNKGRFSLLKTFGNFLKYKVKKRQTEFTCMLMTQRNFIKHSGTYLMLL